jgi:hypothetical protein
MPNNAFFRRAQIGINGNLNKTSRQGKVLTAIGNTVTNISTPELGSPSGGPGAVNSGSVTGGIGGPGSAMGGGIFQQN